MRTLGRIPSHIATRNVVAICEGKVRIKLLWQLYAKGPYEINLLGLVCLL